LVVDLRTRIRKGPSDIRPDASSPFRSPGPLRIWREGGIGDLVFMEPALRRLKALDPSRELIHCAPARVEWLSHRIGFDRLEPHEKRVTTGPGVDVQWALENHPAMLHLDRVSLWELIFQLPVGDMMAEVERPSCAPPPTPATTKDRLFFSPWTSAGVLGRSIPPEVSKKLVAALKPKYQVVTCVRDNPSELMNIGADVMHIGLSTQAWAAAIAACDVALSADTGSLYLAAAMGLPTVGIYEHVGPWLRIRRVPNIHDLWLRDPTCHCDHHGACTKRPDTQQYEPCKLDLDPEVVLEALGRVELFRGMVYCVPERMMVDRPVFSVTRSGKAFTRGEKFIICEVMAGTNWRYNYDGADVVVTIPDDAAVTQKDLWIAMQRALMPNPHGPEPVYGFKRLASYNIF